MDNIYHLLSPCLKSLGSSLFQSQPQLLSQWSSVLLTGLSSLYNNSELSDVYLIASNCTEDESFDDNEIGDNNDEEQLGERSRKFPAHRVVLAAATPYFRALFAPRPEGAALEAAGVGSVIRLGSVTPAALEAVLRFVYTGEFHFSPFLAQAVYEAAALLQLDSLLERLRQGMSNCIGPENCVPLYLLADAHGDNRLKEAAYAFMKADARSLADVGALDDAPDWLIKRLLADECLRVQCESDALYTLIRWTAASPHSRLAAARDNLRCHIRYNLVAAVSSDAIRTSTTPASASMLACLGCVEVEPSLSCLLQPPPPTTQTSMSTLLTTPRLGNRSRLLYLGGRGGGRSWRDDADLTSADSLDAWTGSWQPMEQLPSRRCLFAATLAADSTAAEQAVLIAGGEADGMLLDDCWLMNLADGDRGRWRSGPSLPGPRAEHCLVRLRHLLLLLGGLGQAHDPTVLCLSGPDYSASEWRQISSLPACRRGASAVASPLEDGGFVDFLGGLDAFDQPCRSWHRYDLASDYWMRMPDLPTPLAHFGLVSSPADKALYCLGGCLGGSGGPTASCWRFNGGNRWEPLPPMPSPRQRFCAALIGLEIFVVGGESRPFMDLGHSVEPALLASGVDVFDLRANCWRQVGPDLQSQPLPRTDACLLAVPYV